MLCLKLYRARKYEVLVYWRDIQRYPFDIFSAAYSHCFLCSEQRFRFLEEVSFLVEMVEI